MARLLFDFGLVVLIWIVQLVIYPSFQYYDQSNLMRWHDRYTKAISLVVVPLMFGQLFIALYQVSVSINLRTVLSMGLVIGVWISTFAQFVPMHRTISQANWKDGLLQKLVCQNWLRTFLWNVIFILDLTALFYV